MKVERHHMICLSLGFAGIDHPCNIIVLTAEEHQLVHKTLNFPYWRMREHYKKVNGSLDLQFIIAKQMKMLELYFTNFEKLPPEIQLAHTVCMREMIQYLFTLFNQRYNNYDAERDFPYHLKVLVHIWITQSKKPNCC